MFTSVKSECSMICNANYGCFIAILNESIFCYILEKTEMSLRILYFFSRSEFNVYLFSYVS